MLVEYIQKDKSYVLEFGHKYIRFSCDHGTVLDDYKKNPLEIATPYKLSELKELQYIQNGDILYLFHKNHPVHTLNRNGNFWVFKEFKFKNSPYGNVNTTTISMQISATEGNILITSSEKVFTENDVGRYIRLTLTSQSTRMWQAGKDYEVGAYIQSDKKFYTCVTGGVSGTIKPVHTQGTESDGGVQWEYDNCGYGSAVITDFISDTEVRATTIEKFPYRIRDNGTDYWELGLFRKGNYPICGEFFRGRLAVFLNDVDFPKVCLSCSDDYNNFADKDFGEILATNAITVPIMSNKREEASWLGSSDRLFVGTTGGEHYIDSADSSNALAPDNVKTQQIASFGSLPIKPVKIGTHLLFVTASGTTIRDIVFSFESDAYDPIDFSLLGKHLLKSGIVGMKYQEYPDKVLWIVVNDGRLIGITFSSEQKVVAMHQHNLSGNVKSIAVIENPDTLSQDLWLEVKRQFEGRSVSSIEWIDNNIYSYPNEINRINNVDEKKKAEEEYIKRNAFFMDSGVVGDIESPYKPFSGFFSVKSENLIGKEISIQESPRMSPYKKITPKSFDEAFDIYSDEYDEEKKICPTVNIPFVKNDSPIYSFTLSNDFIGMDFELGIFYKEISGEHGYLKISENVIKNNELSFDISDYIDKNITTVHMEFCRQAKDGEITLKGLSHLEGQEVCVFADGAELERQIVKDGAIRLNKFYEKVSVGLPMISEYIPQTMFINLQGDSGVGAVQRIDHIVLMLWCSMGGRIGSNYKTLQDIYFRKTDDRMNNSSPLFTGNKEIPLNLNTSTIEQRGASILIYNDSAFPMVILAIAPKLYSSGSR